MIPKFRAITFYMEHPEFTRSNIQLDRIVTSPEVPTQASESISSSTTNLFRKANTLFDKLKVAVVEKKERKKENSYIEGNVEDIDSMQHRERYWYTTL